MSSALAIRRSPPSSASTTNLAFIEAARGLPRRSPSGRRATGHRVLERWRTGGCPTTAATLWNLPLHGAGSPTRHAVYSLSSADIDGCAARLTLERHGGAPQPGRRRLRMGARSSLRARVAGHILDGVRAPGYGDHRRRRAWLRVPLSTAAARASRLRDERGKVGPGAASAPAFGRQRTRAATIGLRTLDLEPAYANSEAGLAAPGAGSRVGKSFAQTRRPCRNELPRASRCREGTKMHTATRAAAPRRDRTRAPR